MSLTIPTPEQCREWGIHHDQLLQMDATLRGWVERDEKPCLNALVMRNGHDVFAASYGKAGPEPNAEPLDFGYIYPMSSLTKPIIAALLVKLQEMGEIDLQDPVSRYLPVDAMIANYGNDSEPNLKQVEIWQMLCHTSGLTHQGVNDFLFATVERKFGIKPPEWSHYDEYSQAVNAAMGLPDNDNGLDLLTLATPLCYKPRAKTVYCGVGLQLGKLIVEAVTGEDIDTAAKRLLFDLLGMNDSYFVLPKALYPRVVRRDPIKAHGNWYNSESLYGNTNGGGGLKSTIRDIARFGQMLCQNGTVDGVRVLSRLSVEAMVRNYNSGMNCNEVPFPAFEGWALGLNIRGDKFDDNGLVQPPHSLSQGGAGGTRLTIDRENGLVMVIFAVNYGEDDYVYYGRFANMAYALLV